MISAKALRHKSAENYQVSYFVVPVKPYQAFQGMKKLRLNQSSTIKFVVMTTLIFKS